MAKTMAKGYKGMGMEGSVARWYEKTTRKDMNQYQELAVRLEANLPAGSDVLEVAPGPGFLSIELARSGKLHVHALEISKTMVELTGRNAADAHVNVDIEQGNASAMPFADNSFDLLVCRAAFKNFSEPVKALKEMHRVLRSGGSGVIIDLRRDTPMSAIREYVNGIGIGTNQPLDDAAHLSLYVAEARLHPRRNRTDADEGAISPHRGARGRDWYGSLV